MPNFRLGNILGFPVTLTWSFFLLLLVAPLFFGGWMALVMLVFVFSSVLLHELGHAIVARRKGIEVAGIDLNFFGGAAKMLADPINPLDEVQIAAAGPAVSLMLAGLGLGLGVSLAAPLLVLFGWVNLGLALFNLIPAFPMDGGRILRALLEMRFGRLRATEYAVWVARAFSVIGLLAAIVTGHFYLGLIAVFLWMMGTRELHVTRLVSHRRYDPIPQRAFDPRVNLLGRRIIIMRDNYGNVVQIVDEAG